jgi:hypothetical protein
MTRTAVAATQAAASRAEAAADALLAWLQAQPSIGSQRAATGQAEDGSAAEPLAAVRREDVVEADPLVPAASYSAHPGLAGEALLTPRHDPARRERPKALRLPHTDWLHHRVLITGPAADLACLRAAAGGAGTVPWHLDFDHMEEDLFHLLVAPPAGAGALGSPSRHLSLAGARILAGQLRAAAARRHALAVARIGHTAACPFDLHALVPVPEAVLQGGPDEPEALDWLWTHWGTTQALRQVVEDKTAAGMMVVQRAAAPGEAMWALSFWSADWTPWRALAQIGRRWPMLRFETRPSYDMP